MCQKEMMNRIKELEEKVQLLADWAKKMPPYINKTVNEIKSRLDALEQQGGQPSAPAVDEAYLRRQERRMRQMATDLDILAADAMFG
jgi:hypothetical protein